MNELARRFQVFAEKECRGSSELYEHLAHCIAKDKELLHLAAHARQGQPIPNLLFGAVHFLLLKNDPHPLSQYYPSIAVTPKHPTTAFEAFKDFCRCYKKDIIVLLQNKLVQTNEVRRCAYLYPAFCHIYGIAKRPLALIEIGTSAGLQLFWDQYSYSYQSDQKRYGCTDSALQLTAEIKGGNPPLLKQAPAVTKRMGIDLHINDLSNSSDYLWLKALIWPDHAERLRDFENAVSCVAEKKVELIEGDGLELLPAIAARIPKESVVCVFHTHVANQISYEGKRALLACIHTIGESRDVFHLYNNIWDLQKLHLDYYVEGNPYRETLAHIDGHGRWFEWL